ncbi:MAG: HTH-type transcriptional regulator EutR, partial [Hafnia alvei]
MKKKPDLNLHHLFSGDIDPVNCKPLVERENVHQRESQDVYEHACTITAWQQLYDQLRPGKFKGEL